MLLDSADRRLERVRFDDMDHLKIDPRRRRIYAKGFALEKVLVSAPILAVGLKFLLGADRSQVNRSEQLDIEEKEADHKDALWRVATAGSLLSQFNISQDLQIVQTDQTASNLARAEYQARERDQIFPDRQRALARRKRYPDTVIIDSEHVTIVKDLQTGDWDLRGLLVEADGSSLWDLMVNLSKFNSQREPEDDV